jgi:hypothetical protein
VASARDDARARDLSAWAAAHERHQATAAAFDSQPIHANRSCQRLVDDDPASDCCAGNRERVRSAGCKRKQPTNFTALSSSRDRCMNLNQRRSGSFFWPVEWKRALLPQFVSAATTKYIARCLSVCACMPVAMMVFLPMTDSIACRQESSEAAGFAYSPAFKPKWARPYTTVL